jgi:PIN domain nuclease of toxin-antitoxin system
MKYLLDTHSFIWAIRDTNKLSKKASKIIEDTNNDVWVSVVTFWEMSIKHSLGKLSLGNVSPEDFIGFANNSQISIVGLSAALAASSHQLPCRKNHKDPFDRMLIWKALKSDFHVISKDSDFSLYSDLGLQLIW